MGDIQDKLTEHGADHIAVSNENREPVALAFQIDGRSYIIRANIDGMVEILSTIPRAIKTREQAARTAWKCIRDWVFAQIALVEAEQASLAEIMLPYMQTASGVSVFEALLSGPLLLEGM